MGFYKSVYPTQTDNTKYKRKTGGGHLVITGQRIISTCMTTLENKQRTTLRDITACLYFFLIFVSPAFFTQTSPMLLLCYCFVSYPLVISHPPCSELVVCSLRIPSKYQHYTGSVGVTHSFRWWYIEMQRWSEGVQGVDIYHVWWCWRGFFIMFRSLNRRRFSFRRRWSAVTVHWGSSEITCKFKCCFIRN